MARVSILSALFLSLGLAACGEKAPSAEPVANVQADPKPEPKKEEPK